MEHPIGNLMDTTMDKIKEMIDVNTIVGEPITAADGTLVIPVSKVSYGFAAGGSSRCKRLLFLGVSFMYASLLVSRIVAGFFVYCKPHRQAVMNL